MALRQLSRVFKIKKITELSLNDMPSLCECIGQYIKRVEPETKMSEVLSLLHNNIRDGAVWFLYNRNDVVGFLGCSIRTNLYRHTVCVVDFLGVGEEARLKGYAKQMADIGIAWVKQQNIKKIIFGTTRNAKAMCRFLPGDWKIDSTVIALCV